MKKGLLLSCFGVGLLTLSGCTPRSDITQEELARRTQELVNAVAVGDQAPWKRYFSEDCMFFDERGRNMNKQALVAEITPLPEGSSGTITIVRIKSHIESNVVIMSYDLDEKEIIFGQEMMARYHETDTWLRRKGSWQIVAGQVLRYYEDPAPGQVDLRMFADFVGTYELAPTKMLTISQDEGRLFRQGGDGPKVELVPEATGVFFRKGVEGRTLFRRGKQGEVATLIERRNNEDLVWKKVMIAPQR
jgi:hypothetical protein